MPEEKAQSNNLNALQFEFEGNNYDEYVSPGSSPSLISIAEKNNRPSISDGQKGSIITGLNVAGKDVMGVHTGSQWKYATLSGSGNIEEMENRIKELEDALDISSQGLTHGNTHGTVRMYVASGTTVSGSTNTTTVALPEGNPITDDNFICIYGSVKNGNDDAWHGNSTGSSSYMTAGVGFVYLPGTGSYGSFTIYHEDNDYNSQEYRLAIFYNSVNF